ncbi:hypothetical protein Ocin01_01234, partial [Orchesella cincta]
KYSMIDDDIPTAETAPLLHNTRRRRSESYTEGYPGSTDNLSPLNHSKTKKHKKKRWNSSMTPSSSPFLEPEPSPKIPDHQTQIKIRVLRPPQTSFENLYQEIVQETAAAMIDISSSRPTNTNLCSSSSREYTYRVNHYQFTLRKVPKTVIPDFQCLLTDVDEKYSEPFDEGVPIATDDIRLMDESLNEIISAMEEFEVQNTDDIVVNFPMPANTILAR